MKKRCRVKPGMTIRTSTNGDFHLKTPTFSKLP